MISVNRRRAQRSGTDAGLEQMRAEFHSRSCVRLPGFIEASFLAQLWDLLEEARFREHTHGGIGVDQCAAPGRLTALLLLVMNDPALFAFVSELTGCAPIGVFEGRVYRMLPGGDHVDSWHSDAVRDRLVAISINLARQSATTAPLQIRRRDSETILHEVVNSTPGDAVLFRVDPVYVHRIKPVPQAGPRLAYAGWFCAGSDLRQRLLEGSAHFDRHKSRDLPDGAASDTSA